MRSDDGNSSDRVGRVLRPVEADDEGGWPAGWPPGAPEREHGGWERSRWQIPPRAGLLVGTLALLLVVAVPVMMLVRQPGRGVELPSPRGVWQSAASTADAARPFSASSSSVTGPVAAATGAVLSAVPSASGSVGVLRVYVVGQVRRPGVVSLASGARVEDAVQAVGGATGRADLARLNLARRVVDGEQIVVPRPGERVTEAVGGAGAAAGSDGTASTGVPAAPVDLNAGTLADFDALPGIGPVIAGRIIAWRQQNGRFARVDDLAEVQGIGAATMARLRPLVRV